MKFDSWKADQEWPELYILVAGTRTFDDYELLERTWDSLIASCPFEHVRVHIVHGGAKGADTLAQKYGMSHQCTIHEFLANWDEYGRAAGPMRNKKMHEFIKDKEYRVCVCFWDGKSRGTKDNFKWAKKYFTPLMIIQC